MLTFDSHFAGEAMICPGLVSITFRALSPEAIIALAVEAGLDGIEWGGDIHVPSGERQRARQIRRMTEEAGLAVTSYGSYYRAGHPERGEFEPVLETAVELGTPLIRVWAGSQGSEAADAAYRDQVIRDSRRIVALAAQAGLRVAYEFHRNTLTDTNDSALGLLRAVEGSRSYWQPPVGRTIEYNLAGLEAISSWLEHLHIFSWKLNADQEVERLPLAAKETEWRAYLARTAATGHDHFALLEFVEDDDPTNFLKDAVTLKAWLAALNGNSKTPSSEVTHV